MGRLIYSALCSLDGYTADATGDFGWCAPDEEVHAFVNDLERPLGTYLYGRRMYEVMTYWQDPPPDEGPISEDFAQLWQAADKVVYSTTLGEVSTPKTRLERTFDPAAVRDLVRAADAPVGIGGPSLAGQAISAGLVDELQLFHVPVVVGGGTRVLPDVRLSLELLEQRRFGNGTTFVRYRLTG